jgi:hypothetical protein
MAQSNKYRNDCQYPSPAEYRHETVRASGGFFYSLKKKKPQRMVPAGVLPVCHLGDHWATPGGDVSSVLGKGQGERLFRNAEQKKGFGYTLRGVHHHERR